MRGRQRRDLRALASASAAMDSIWCRSELPGRGARAAESFSCNIDELVEQLCLEHARVLETPYALFGHSMGGLLAYGMARHLQQQGRALPLMLFASASPAPSSGSWKFSGRDSDEALLRDLHRYGGTPEDVSGKR